LQISDTDGESVTFTHGSNGALAFTAVGGGQRVSNVIDEGRARALAGWLAAMYPDETSPAPVAQPVADGPMDEELMRAHREHGEFVNAGSTHMCPHCGTATMYRMFTGGKEWCCPGCEADGPYPDGRAPSRAGLLATDEGRTALREQMAAHLAQLREGDAGADREAE
jgi:ribosomal protein L37AE/L43A